MLGADEVVVEEPGFLLGENQDSAGSVGETFEQVDRLLERLCLQSVYRWRVCLTHTGARFATRRGSLLQVSELFVARSSSWRSF